jgi:hypothetical protein
LAPRPGAGAANRDISATDPRGELVVQVRYGGRSYDPSAPTADDDCELLVDVGVPTWSGNAVRY